MALILVVDDEPDTREYLGTLLEDNGFTVITAVDGEDGIAKLKENKPDLVVLDMIMPKASGVKLYRSLRTEQDLMNTPVIVSTGIGRYKDLFDKDRDQLPKPDAFLEKPINEKEFVETAKKLTG